MIKNLFVSIFVSHYLESILLRTRKYQSEIGMTLAESMLAIMILQVAVLGMIYTVNAGYSHIEVSGETVEASRLGEELIEEIVTRSYADPDGGEVLGPDTGESDRADFDDIDDYDGYAEAAGSVLLLDGSNHEASAQVYSRSVTVEASAVNFTDFGSVVNGKTIMVTVTYPDGKTYEITRFVKESS